MSYSLFITAGTKVLSPSGVVELIGSVFIDNATRDEDGAYRYTVGGTEYVCAGGCCKATPNGGPVKHKDGLVVFA